MRSFAAAALARGRVLALGLVLLVLLAAAGCARVEIHPALLGGAEVAQVNDLQQRLEDLSARVEQLEALRAAPAHDAAPPARPAR
jgi:outer membrane murein-binding lipoprotein Lpp